MIHCLELGDYCEIAGDLLGIDASQIARLPNIGLAESALAAPRAGFGDQEVYPTLLEKAAVLVERLARNHPLPDGNKRSAFVALWLFMDANQQVFAGTDPDADVPMVERIAAGEAARNEIVAWLEARTASSG